MIRHSSVFVILGLIAANLSAQSITAEFRNATAPRIESHPVDPYMSDAEEQTILRRLQEHRYIPPTVRTLGALPSTLLRDLTVVIDNRSLEEIGFNSDAEFEHDEGAETMSLGANLIRILRHLDLTFLIRHGRIEILTEDEAAKDYPKRIYDITPLLSIKRQNGRAEVNTDSIVEGIQSLIQPDNWEPMGGAGTIVPLVVRSRCLLVVSASTTMHLEVDQLLNQIDRISVRPGEAPLMKRHVDVSNAMLPVVKKPTSLPVFGGVF